MRLEPAESARLPRGGALRTPVYVTQARRPAPETAPPAHRRDQYGFTGEINGTSAGCRGSLVRACAQRSRVPRAATRCIARPHHPSMFIGLPSQERLLSHAMCVDVESTRGIAAVLEKKCASTPTRRHRPPAHAGHAGTG